MTDRQALEAMLTRAGVVFRDEPHEVGRRGDMEIASALTIPSGDPPNFGYWGFFSVAMFDKNGRLIGWAVWE